ncbi:hypothetical protein NHX12_002419 [Muraenolepis orangiensis]|uniref:Uncharacterized protein n=1 Tax=Muraenolepis orangiensis TaxID=630683 RepID=A0A9Q0DW57_9TELE|nr:hypothetical protein NHX12_002419 [Muraenolepis orangiensis]
MSGSGGQRGDPGPWPPRTPRTAPSIQVFDPREERLAAEGQSDEGRGQMAEKGRSQSDGWMTVYGSVPVREKDLEPLDYDLDLSRELSTPQKVPIPERYVESDPDDPQSPEELEQRCQRAQRIRTLLAKSRSESGGFYSRDPY